jgi:hypothetical protein
VAIEDGVDGMEVYASSYGEMFSLPFPITQRTWNISVVVSRKACIEMRKEQSTCR